MVMSPVNTRRRLDDPHAAVSVSLRCPETVTASKWPADDTARLAGTVIETGPRCIILLVDEPAPGTAFLTSEDGGGFTMISVWSYLYGPDGATAAQRDDPRWRAWLTTTQTAQTETPDSHSC